MAKKSDAEMAREWADLFEKLNANRPLRDLLRRLAAQSEENVALRKTLGELWSAVHAVRDELGTQYPALSEAYVSAKEALDGE